MENSNKISKIKQCPLISVVVPVYNIEEYLTKCLDSILNQTYENIEIVLVNDGSTDSTGQIADNYQGKYPNRIKCLHLENGGVLRARLKGIAVATGEWIGFVDGDDEIEADMYERLINNAHLYGADISHCGYQTIVNNGERIHYFRNTGRIVEQDKIKGVSDLIEGVFVEPGLWNKIFKKSLFLSFKEEQLLQEKIKINEDLLMNYLLFKQAEKSVYEDFCPYHYMVRSTSATRSEFKAYKVLDPIRVRKFIFEDVRAENKGAACQKYLLSCMGAYAALHGVNEYKERCTDLKSELLRYRDKWNGLRKADFLKLKLLLLSPKIYKVVYGFYEKHFQKKVYE